MSQILIGDADGQHVSINVVHREREDAYDADDGNWLVTQVSVRAGAWSGSFKACLRTDELVAFRRQLKSLYRTLDGAANYGSLENWLALHLKADKFGHVSVRGEAIDECGSGNLLTFHFEIDQSYLPKIIAQLEAVEQTFPMRGLR